MESHQNAWLRSLAFDRDGNLYLGKIRITKVSPTVDRSGVITTVAGTGVCGFSGDGGRATQAQIGEPSFMAADADDLFFIDATARRIRRLHFATGTISSLGFGLDLPSGGDDGGIALDPQGNIFTIDDNQSRSSEGGGHHVLQFSDGQRVTIEQHRRAGEPCARYRHDRSAGNRSLRGRDTIDPRLLRDCRGAG